MDRTTARRKLDRRLARLRPVKELATPQRGWIRAIRDAIGMTAVQLAARLKVSPSTIHDLEKAEAESRITLSSLERAAAAMDCTLIYALVPRRPLEELVEERARKVADEILERVDHTMRLEAQGVDADDMDDARARLADKLIREKPRSLWKLP